MDDEVECQSDVEEVANSLQHNPGSKESEQEAPSVPWSELPPFAVERIYSFLSREEQSSMSQVCKNWSEEYSSPNLWRKITFNLPEQALTSDMHPAVRSAQRYGRYFQHVRVFRRRRYRRAMPEVIQKQLKLFLQFLAEHSQLLSISFINISWHDDNEDFRQNLINLLLTQNKLQSVKFDKSRFKRNVAEEILQAIFSRNSRSLKKLELLAFMDESSDVVPTDTIIDVPLAFETLMNLKLLIVDYSQFFESIITSIYEYGSGLPLQKKGNLEDFLLGWDGTESIHYNGVQPEAWKYFGEIFPALKMTVFTEIRNQPAENIDFFLVRHMPITRLFLKWEANHSELGTVLRHLIECEINSSLEILYVLGLKKNDNLAQDLLNLLRAFPKLEQLQLDVQSRVNDLNFVFEYWLENGSMSLKDVHIIIRNVSDSALISNYANLSEIYVPLLQVVGLNLIIVSDND